eukprot:scaffold33859_cov28-Tisochrysis_lutea.AAC.1
MAQRSGTENRRPHEFQTKPPPPVPSPSAPVLGTTLATRGYAMLHACGESMLQATGPLLTKRVARSDELQSSAHTSASRLSTGSSGEIPESPTGA